MWLFVFVCVVAATPVVAQSLLARMIAAEDARVATDAAVAPLVEGLKSTDPQIAARAVRGLGRFERPAFLKHMLPLVTHARPAVRREAINAIGQAFAAVSRTDSTPIPELDGVVRLLLDRLRLEKEPQVVGTLAETLGRLPYRSADAIRTTERALASVLPATDGDIGASPLAVAGAAIGLDTLLRVHKQPAEPTTADRLRAAAAAGADPADVDATVARRRAWLAVIAATAPDAPLVERGLDDGDFQVRRLATAASGQDRVGPVDRRRLLARALADPVPQVRYEALRVYSRTLQSQDCAPVVAATKDSDRHVVLAALDALGNGCPAGGAPIDLLASLVDALPATGDWHAGAHAFVSLAKLNREAATPRLARVAEHPTWQVRAYAARGATELGAAARLERMAADGNQNVRHAAVAGLRRIRGHEADAIYIAALRDGDYQLVLEAAQALEGSPAPAAAPALVDAFARLSADRRDTSRDPRVAILLRLREIGGLAHASRLQSCLTDFDPVVARECAMTLQRWTGAALAPKPVVRRPAPVPAALPSLARMVFAGGRVIELRLLADEAPASVARFVRLARQGYYNRLDVHRVVPNFVVQGGSPGANEYAGDGPFMRDELGLVSNARGTLGVSARGRDTGDAQFYINLLDNPRLDHDYTVFAQIVTGIEVADRLLEGDVIERVEVP